jgi:hypothetical protein
MVLRLWPAALQVPALQRLHQLRDAGVWVPQRSRAQRGAAPDGRPGAQAPLPVGQGGGPLEPERLSERGTDAARDRLVRRSTHCSSRSQCSGWVRRPQFNSNILLFLLNILGNERCDVRCDISG